MRVKEGNKEKDILEAAVKVFALHGYHVAKISKIAEVANVATGSVYVYFKNKEDILLKIFANLWSVLHNEFKLLQANTSLSSTEKIDGMVDLIFDVLTADQSLAMVVVNEQSHLQKSNKKEFTDFYDKFMGVGEEIILDGIKNNLFTADVDVKIFKQYVFGAVRHLIHCWANEPEKFPINKIRQNVKSLIKYGITK
jgi:TetR/AcrR family fatty acid metabolism transcriptional regulator